MAKFGQKMGVPRKFGIYHHICVVENLFTKSKESCRYTCQMN